MITNTLDKEIALGLLRGREIVVAPNCKSSIIHKLFFRVWISESLVVFIALREAVIMVSIRA